VLKEIVEQEFRTVPDQEVLKEADQLIKNGSLNEATLPANS
jgi:hypothetical protein